MAAARDHCTGRSSLLRTFRCGLASDRRSLREKLKIRSRHFRRIDDYPTAGEDGEQSTAPQLAGQNLRNNLRLETRASLEQGSNSCGVSESQQLRQSPTRARSRGARLLRKVGARSDVLGSGFPRWPAASADTFQSVEISGARTAKIRAVAQAARAIARDNARATTAPGAIDAGCGAF